MQALVQFSSEAEARNLDFLVIGGQAIIAYGINRNTIDLDLLISRKQREAWSSLAQQLGYRVFHEHENFLQLSASQPQAWPVDLMLVDEPTFQTMLTASKAVCLAGTNFKVPKIQHLIALKLHAYGTRGGSKGLKDLLDILELVRIAKIDTGSEGFRKFCLKYVSLSQYETLRETEHRQKS